MNRYLIINISDEKDDDGAFRHKKGPTPVFLTEIGKRLDAGMHVWAPRVDEGTKVNAEPKGTLLRILEGDLAKKELAAREKAKTKAAPAPAAKVKEADDDPPPPPKKPVKVTEVDPAAAAEGGGKRQKVTELDENGKPKPADPPASPAPTQAKAKEETDPSKAAASKQGASKPAST